MRSEKNRLVCELFLLTKCKSPERGVGLGLGIHGKEPQEDRERGAKEVAESFQNLTLESRVCILQQVYSVAAPESSSQPD